MATSRILIVATVFAALAASVAAGAATVQAYVSWNGRNDMAKATILSTLAHRCGDAYLAGYRYLSALSDAHKDFAEEKLTDEAVRHTNALLSDVREKFTLLDITRTAIEGKYPSSLKPIDALATDRVRDRSHARFLFVRDAATEMVIKSMADCVAIMHAHSR